MKKNSLGMRKWATWNMCVYVRDNNGAHISAQAAHNLYRFHQYFILQFDPIL